MWKGGVEMPTRRKLDKIFDLIEKGEYEKVLYDDELVREINDVVFTKILQTHNFEYQMHLYFIIDELKNCSIEIFKKYFKRINFKDRILEYLKDEFHPRFFKVFSNDEILEIYQKSCSCDYNTFVIFTEKEYFEIKTDDEELLIWYDLDDGNKTFKEEEKDKFFEMLRRYPVKKPKCIVLEDE